MHKTTRQVMPMRNLSGETSERTMTQLNINNLLFVVSRLHHVFYIYILQKTGMELAGREIGCS